MGKEEVEAAIAILEAAVRRIDTWVLWCALAVAIGVAGELVLGIAHWKKDRELRPLRMLQSQLHEKEVLQLKLDLRTQGVVLADAQLATALAGRDNAIANQSTMALIQQALLKLGMITSGEMSEPARSFQIIPKVSHFAGTKFDAIVTSKDIGLGTLLLSLRNALKASGWIEASASERPGIDHASARGITIGVNGS